MMISFRSTSFGASAQRTPGWVPVKWPIEGPAAVSRRLGRPKHALVCEWNLYKIDHRMNEKALPVIDYELEFSQRSLRPAKRR